MWHTLTLKLVKQSIHHKLLTVNRCKLRTQIPFGTSLFFTGPKASNSWRTIFLAIMSPFMQLIHHFNITSGSCYTTFSTSLNICFTLYIIFIAFIIWIWLSQRDIRDGEQKLLYVWEMCKTSPSRRVFFQLSSSLAGVLPSGHHSHP